jgi:hypothetical protein
MTGHSVSVNFSKPHFIVELGEEGLTSLEIAASLGVEHRDVLQKLRRGKWISHNCLIFKYAAYTTYNQNNKLVDVYALNVPAAKAFVARWSNLAGDGYLAFLFECERVVTEEVPKLRQLVAKLQQQWKPKHKGLPRGRPKGTIDVPVEVSTLFGSQIEWVTVFKEQASVIQKLLSDRNHLLRCRRGYDKRLAEIERKLEIPTKEKALPSNVKRLPKAR